MKTFLTLGAMLLTTSAVTFLFISCSRPEPRNTGEEQPKALEDKSVSYDIISKRHSSDLVNSLYYELVDKDPELKKLATEIDALTRDFSDSTASFENFDEKNRSYFSSAKGHLVLISDSLLRNKMKLLVNDQLAKYSTQVHIHNELLKDIEARRLILIDRLNALKIIRTLPLIDQYQKNNLPSTEPLQAYLKSQMQTINLLETLSKK